MELSYAELWRRLTPVAIRLGLPRPSYGSVRTIVSLVRALERQRRPVRDDVVVKLLTGRIPSDSAIELVQMNTSGSTWWERIEVAPKTPPK